MISRDSEVPPWRQLAGILRDRIMSGEYTGRLPGERHLAQEYGLALVTVRKAVHLLRDFIAGKRPSGAFVLFRSMNLQRLKVIPDPGSPGNPDGSRKN